MSIKPTRPGRGVGLLRRHARRYCSLAPASSGCGIRHSRSGTGAQSCSWAEPWGVAVVLGSIPFLFGLGFTVWAVRNLGGRERIYVVTRASLYLVLGVGLVAGHWSPSIGVASMAFFFIGVVSVALAGRRILGSGSASR